MLTFLEFRQLINEELSRKDLKKHFSNLNDGDYNKVIDIDPTSTKDNVGKYTTWLLNLFRDKKLKLDDAEKITNLLKQFNDKSKTLARKKISKYSGIEDLSKALGGKDDKAIERPDYLDYGSKVVYRDKDWLVEIPQSYKQSCQAYGDKTSWCTASKDNGPGYYNSYKNRGEVYVVRKPKLAKPEFQIFVSDDGEEEEAKNRRNTEYDYSEIFKKYPKLMNFFKKLSPELFDHTNQINIKGNKIKFTVNGQGIRVFKNVDLSDLQLTKLPDLAAA